GSDQDRAATRGGGRDDSQGFLSPALFSASLACFCFASHWRASSALIRPSPSVSSMRNSSSLPRNSLGETSPSLLRSILVNHIGAAGLEGRLGWRFWKNVFCPWPRAKVSRRGASGLDNALSVAL